MFRAALSMNGTMCKYSSTLWSGLCTLRTNVKQSLNRSKSEHYHNTRLPRGYSQNTACSICIGLPFDRYEITDNCRLNRRVRSRTHGLTRQIKRLIQMSTDQIEEHPSRTTRTFHCCSIFPASVLSPANLGRNPCVANPNMNSPS